MATQLNDWLTVDKNSGTGNAEITLTASSYEEFVERTASLKIQGISANAILNVRQNAFVPQVKITPSVLNMESIGGSETITITSNVDLELVSDADWFTISKNYPTEGTTNITITVETNVGDIRLGIIRVLTLVGKIEIAQITITQKAFDGSDYVSLVYETTKENEILRLTRDGYTDGINGKYITITGYVDVIIIDGVVQTFTLDKFTIPQAGEHQVYMSFKDKTLRWIDDYCPFYKNEKLKRITIPSDYIMKEGIRSYGFFHSCTKLEYANLNGVMLDFNGQNTALFARCNNLKYVYNYRLLNDREITANICTDCPKLEEFTIYNDAIPYSIGSTAFWGCELLPNDFILRYVHKKGDGTNRIGTGAFAGCSLLNGEDGTIDFSGWASIGGAAFVGCSLIKEVYVNAGGVYGTPAFGIDGGYKSAFYEIGDILHIMDNSTFNLTNTTFKKVICHKPLNNIGTTWFGSKKRSDDEIYPLVEEIEFLSEEQQDMRYESESGLDWGDGKFAYLPNLKKLIFHSTLPPIVNYNTLKNTTYNGTLVYPEGADYSQLLSTDEYYLGYYGWNDIIVPNPYFNLSKTNITIGKGSTNVAITLETNARWYIETDASWLSVSQNSGLQGTTNFDIVVSENNTSNIRTGSITIYSETGIEERTITITQYNEYGDRLLYTSTTKDVVNIKIYTATTATDGSAVSIISNTYDAENDIGTIIFNKDVSYLIAEFENASAITHITLPALIKKIQYLEVGSVEELKLPSLLESMGPLTFRYSSIGKIYFGENFSEMSNDCFSVAPREMYFTTLTPPKFCYQIGYSGYVGGRTTVYVPTEALDAYKGIRTYFWDSKVTITSITS